MKFYQTIASVVLSITYSATIFGSETLLDHPDEMWNTVQSKLGKIYKETGHIKSYSRPLDLLTNYASSIRKGRIYGENILQNTFFPTFSALSLAGLTSLISNKIRLRSIFLSTAVGLIIAKTLTKKLANSYLVTKYPQVVEIIEHSDLFILQGQKTDDKNFLMETRYLSTMELDKELTLQTTPFIADKKLLLPRDLIRRARLIYELEDLSGKVNIYLSNDNYKNKNKVSSLSSKVISFDVSQDQKTIVTLDKDYNVRKWELLSLEYIQQKRFEIEDLQ